jgi:hypothetical protein
MLDHSTTPKRTPKDKPWLRTARWVGTFIGFPLGGLAASILVGPINSGLAGIVGGLLTGAVLGAAQAVGLGLRGAAVLRWIAATSAGLGAGLGIGATAVGFATSLQELLVQGAISGFFVGVAQAVLLRRSLGSLALYWPPALAAFWAIGWFITTSVGVQVDQQWTVFGAAGAITVTALTAVLPTLIARKAASAQATPTSMRSAS